MIQRFRATSIFLREILTQQGIFNGISSEAAAAIFIDQHTRSGKAMGEGSKHIRRKLVRNYNLGLKQASLLGDEPLIRIQIIEGV